MEVYVIKVTLLGISPPVWRRALVHRDITLRNLHKTLQTVMGWTNSHLHQFVFNSQKYSDPKFGLGAGIIDESRTRLGDVICIPGARLLYEYDFGDGWQHELLLEEVLLGDESFRQICVVRQAYRQLPYGLYQCLFTLTTARDSTLNRLGPIGAP